MMQRQPAIDDHRPASGPPHDAGTGQDGQREADRPAEKRIHQQQDHAGDGEVAHAGGPAARAECGQGHQTHRRRAQHARLGATQGDENDHSGQTDDAQPPPSHADPARNGQQECQQQREIRARYCGQVRQTSRLKVLRSAPGRAPRCHRAQGQAPTPAAPGRRFSNRLPQPRANSFDETKAGRRRRDNELVSHVPVTQQPRLILDLVTPDDRPRRPGCRPGSRTTPPTCGPLTITSTGARTSQDCRLGPRSVRWQPSMTAAPDRQSRFGHSMRIRANLQIRRDHRLDASPATRQVHDEADTCRRRPRPATTAVTRATLSTSAERRRAATARPTVTPAAGCCNAGAATPGSEPRGSPAPLPRAAPSADLPRRARATCRDRQGCRFRQPPQPRVPRTALHAAAAQAAVAEMLTPGRAERSGRTSWVRCRPPPVTPRSD